MARSMATQPRIPQSYVVTGHLAEDDDENSDEIRAQLEDLSKMIRV